MRIAVISDSHKNPFVVDRIIRKEPEAQHIVFLGDVTEDVENLKYEYPEKIFHIISGNCDGFSDYPAFDIIKIENVDIYITHGHLFDVNSGVDRLLGVAKNAGAKILLFGHTHIAQNEYKDGVYIINPGSCARPRDGKAGYAVIDILESGILPTLKPI